MPDSTNVFHKAPRSPGQKRIISPENNYHPGFNCLSLQTCVRFFRGKLVVEERTKWLEVTPQFKQKKSHRNTRAICPHLFVSSDFGTTQGARYCSAFWMKPRDTAWLLLSPLEKYSDKYSLWNLNSRRRLSEWILEDTLRIWRWYLHDRTCFALIRRAGMAVASSKHCQDSWQ